MLFKSALLVISIACAYGGRVRNAPRVDISQSAPDARCHGRADGFYESQPGACSADVLACIGGKAEPIRCVWGLRFDIDAKKCREAKFVRACSRQETPAEVPVIVETPPEQLAFCEGRIDGSYAFPSDCSGQFLTCLNSIPMLQNCPADLRYSRDDDACLEAKYVVGCGGTATTTAAPIQEDETVKSRFEADTRCVGRLDGVYEAHDGVCSAAILCCTNGRADTMLCPEGLRFDSDTEECHQPEFVKACGGQTPVTTEAPVIIQANPPAAQLAFCRNKDDGNYPFPSECSTQFLTCVAGSPLLQQCPSDLRYSKDEDACLEADEVAGCTRQFDTTRSGESTRSYHVRIYRGDRGQ